jgi:membrane fusion protein (multidrug efflux system)
VQLDDEVERADLASSQSALKLAQDNLKRIRQLAERGVSATSDLDTAQSEATQAESTVQRLKAVLDQKQLKAPFSGIIGIPKIDLGQYLTVGTAVATLQQLETMRVDFTVPEQEFANLKLGQAIKVGLSEGDLRFKGEIIGINPKIDPSSRLVTVRGEVENPNEELQPGQFVHVQVQLPVEHDVVALPQTAVTTSLYGDCVFVVRKQETEPANEDGQTDDAPTASVNAESAKADDKKAGADGAKAAEKEAAADKKSAATDKKQEAGDGAKAKQPNLVAKQVFVQVGRRSGQLVEITKGVKAGDVVVSAGQNRLSNGAPVTIDNTVNPADTSKKEAGL